MSVKLSVIIKEPVFEPLNVNIKKNIFLVFAFHRFVYEIHMIE